MQLVRELAGCCQHALGLTFMQYPSSSASSFSLAHRPPRLPAVLLLSIPQTRVYTSPQQRIRAPHHCLPWTGHLR